MTISRASATALLQSVQRGLSPVELVYVPHEKWPLPRSRPFLQRPLQISILDSSFNPPTLAHLALANTPPSFARNPTESYDTKIFLLSVRNADKSLKPTDASYLQRLEMMLLLAQDNVPDGTSNSDGEVAIAIIDEPTFVGKSSKLLGFLERRLSELGAPAPATMRPHLTFILGFDTLERLLSPRYYGASPTDPDAESKMFSSLHKFFSSEHDSSRIVCARRASSSPEADTLSLASEFLSKQQIVLVDIGKDERTYSSTAVRDALSRGNDDGWKRLVPRGVEEYITKEKLYVPL